MSHHHLQIIRNSNDLWCVLDTPSGVQLSLNDQTPFLPIKLESLGSRECIFLSKSSLRTYLPEIFFGGTASVRTGRVDLKYARC